MSAKRLAAGDYKYSVSDEALQSISLKTGTSVRRMQPNRTSIIVVVVQTGVLNVDDIDDSTVFSKDDMGSEDLDPGRIVCLFPFESFLQSHGRVYIK
jgi:hypothetical protein